MGRSKNADSDVLNEVVTKLKNNVKINNNDFPVEKGLNASEDISHEVLSLMVSLPCLCERPLKLIMCKDCGAAFRGRIASRCPRHPSCKYLSDVECCKECKRTNLAEFDLPKGMERVG